MRKTVLIIDDELDLRELLKLTLAKMGVDSTAVETVKEAKTALQEETFDLCLTDMRLPDGNGLELVDYVQKNYPQLPIAVLTAYGNVDLAVDGLVVAFDPAKIFLGAIDAHHPSRAPLEYPDDPAAGFLGHIHAPAAATPATAKCGHHFQFDAHTVAVQSGIAVVA